MFWPHIAKFNALQYFPFCHVNQNNMSQQTHFDDIRDRIAHDDLYGALDMLRGLFENTPRLNEILQQSGRFSYIRQQIRLGIVSHAEAVLTQNQIRFGLLDLLTDIEAEGKRPDLPTDLAQNLLSDRRIAADKAQWVKNLSASLEKQEVVVGDDPLQVFQHYGWLVQNFLFYLVTPPGSRPNAVRLSYMAEAWQGSLRYLCYIQLSQVLQMPEKRRHPAIADFLQMNGDDYLRFDYLGLLMVTTGLLEREKSFIPEIHDLVAKVSDTRNNLYRTVLVLHDRREKLLRREPLAEPELNALLDEYLTALVFWLRNIAFLAKFRLVSIKDINLSYRIGSDSTRFRHLFGELHGYFSPGEVNYRTSSVKGAFTYNQSVLLFRGTDMASCLRNLREASHYISLSPLLLDKSVLVEKSTQTPELYYFTGPLKQPGTYGYIHYATEIFQPNYDPLQSGMEIADQNMGEPKMDDLYEHIETLFAPFKQTAR